MTQHVNDSIASMIGRTPILQLADALVPAGKTMLLKLEGFNPGFSVKDRTAFGLIQHGLKTGRISQGGTLIESTSGNLGKALSMLGAALGFKVIIVADPKVSPSILNLYRAFGAKVEVVATQDESGGYQLARIRRVKELLDTEPGSWWPNQYDNLANQEFHFSHTASEFSGIDYDCVVGAIGTGGHLTGIGRNLRTGNPKIRIVASDIEGSGIFGGEYRPYLTNGVGLVTKAANTDTSVLDGVYFGSDREAFSMCRILAAEHGLLLGGSGGLVVICALAWLHQSNCERAVAIIPDSGVGYLDQFYDDCWLENRGIVLMSRDELGNAIYSKRFHRLRDSNFE